MNLKELQEQKEAHSSRNPKIAAFLKDYGFVKEFGEGVDRMCKELRESGLPDPEYQVESFMLRCTVKTADGGKAGPLAGGTTVRSGEFLGPESILHKSLESLRSRELSKSELAVALGHKSISGKLKLRIRQMLDSGLIEWTLPEKPNSRLQKYRLTHKGRALL